MAGILTKSHYLTKQPIQPDGSRLGDIFAELQPEIESSFGNKVTNHGGRGRRWGRDRGGRRGREEFTLSFHVFDRMCLLFCCCADANCNLLLQLHQPLHAPLRAVLHVRFLMSFTLTHIYIGTNAIACFSRFGVCGWL